MSREPTDSMLITALKEGRQDALRTLYDRHGPWLTARLSHRCTDPQIVDEAIQDTFVAVWQQATSFDDQRGTVGAWIWGIGIRRMIDCLRKQRPTSRLLAEPAHVPSAEESVLEDPHMGDLGIALDRLSPELQAVLTSTVLDGLTIKETAELFDIPVGTVKTRLMRARHKVREALA